MRKRLPLAGLAAALALTVVACGSDEPSDSGSGAAAASALTGEPVKVMVITALSGPSEAFTEIGPSVQAAADAINKAGGIKGRPVEVTVCDDQFDPNKGADCATQAVEGKYLFTTGTSATGDRYMPILEEGKVPAIGNTPNSASELKSPYSYPFISGVIQVAGGGTACGKLGAKQPGVAIVDLAAGRNSASLVDLGLEPFNLPAPTQVFIPPTAADFTTYAASLSDADCVGVVLGGAGFERLVQALRQGGNDATVTYGAGLISQARLDRLGSASEGIVLVGQATAPVSDPSIPAVKKYHDEATAAGLKEEDLSDQGMIMWATTHLVAEMAEKLPTIDGASLAAALDEAGPIDYSPLPKVDFSKSIQVAFPDNRIFTTEVTFSEIKDGKRVPLFDGKPVNVLDAS